MFLSLRFPSLSSFGYWVFVSPHNPGQPKSLSHIHFCSTCPLDLASKFRLNTHAKLGQTNRRNFPPFCTKFWNRLFHRNHGKSLQELERHSILYHRSHRLIDDEAPTRLHLALEESYSELPFLSDLRAAFPQREGSWNGFVAWEHIVLSTAVPRKCLASKLIMIFSPARCWLLSRFC